ncbi:unnamed protein product [Urochloa humidicola]
MVVTMRADEAELMHGGRYRRRAEGRMLVGRLLYVPTSGSACRWTRGCSGIELAAKLELLITAEEGSISGGSAPMSPQKHALCQ